MPFIQRALISVSDTTGIVEFARILQGRGVAILSTGGTATTLRAAGIPLTDVAEYTGMPEMLDGRVKTLHPKIHGGILAMRDKPEHLATLQREGIQPIDCVVVNLYPFQQTVARPGVTLAEAVAQIDIGGPTMLRSAAKNYRDVVVLCDPADYAAVLDEWQHDGSIAEVTAFRLAQKVFCHTARYDAAIAQFLVRQTGQQPFLDQHVLAYEKVRDLRYGENPHQRAAWYRVVGVPLCVGEPLQGKALSYNNLLDADAAIACVQEFADPAVVIVKHANPCGVGEAHDDIVVAYQRALATDPVAAFGGIVATNRPVDRAAAEAMVQPFFEVICAPAFAPEALVLFAAKKTLRLLTYDAQALPAFRVRSACGGRLVQEADRIAEDPATWRVVTQRAPTADERAALRFAWCVAKHAQSNAIVMATAGQALGIGAGQVSRVAAARVATMQLSLRPTCNGSAPLVPQVSESPTPTVSPVTCLVAASDAFFPFPDGVEELARAGVTAVIQPGGSVKDAEVIAAADAHGMAMLCTGTRHFRH